MEYEEKLTVATLTATILNSCIFLAVFIYQLTTVSDFDQLFLRQPVTNPLRCNITATVVPLLIVIILISKRTVILGHMLCYLVYFMIFSLAFFTDQFAPRLNEYYFSTDGMLIVVIGIFLCYMGMGLTWRDLLNIRLKQFNVAGIRYHFVNNIFHQDRRTVITSVIIAVVALLLMAVLITQHPISRLLILLGFSHP